jgi:hypothetical protein
MVKAFGMGRLPSFRTQTLMEADLGWRYAAGKVDR